MLGLKEKHQLTQATSQGVIQGVTGIMQCHLSAICNQIHDQLSSGVSPDTMALFNPLLSEDGTHSQPFHGLETPHQQLSFYRTHFNFIVCGSFNYLVLTFSTMQEPICMCLGECREWKGSGAKHWIVLKNYNTTHFAVSSTVILYTQR